MTGPDRPLISVVIATRRRETRLAFALEALADQTLDPESFEVIVVRAADSLDAELTVAPAGLAVRFMIAPTAGAAAQRNRGWRQASADLVAFTDDDCRPTPDWLEQLLAAARVGTIVQGRTDPDPDEIHLFHGLARTVEVSEPNPWFATCNIVYPRSVLERVGGFDERFEGAWGEDTDLALRAIEAGVAAPRFAPNAVVRHAVHARSFAAAVRDAYGRDALPLLLARHPRQRRELYWRYFLRKRHAKILLAVVGVVVSRRRPALALLTAVPYLESTLDRHHLSLGSSAHQLFLLPLVAIIDAIETIVTARGAIKNRVPVL